MKENPSKPEKSTHNSFTQFVDLIALMHTKKEYGKTDLLQWAPLACYSREFPDSELAKEFNKVCAEYRKRYDNIAALTLEQVKKMEPTDKRNKKLLEDRRANEQDYFEVFVSFERNTALNELDQKMHVLLEKYLKARSFEDLVKDLS